MVFSDLFFLYVFLPSFALLYLLGTWIDKSAAKEGRQSCRARNAVLVAFSFIFYAWGEPVYVFLMLASVVINFFIGRSIDNLDKHRKAMLALGVACNLCVLGIFKYAGFFAHQLQALGIPVSTPDISLPIGISFYIFQGLSYVLDIYFRKTVPTKDAVAFFAFISFFPQLIAGPIERSRDLLPQFSGKKEFDYEETRRGLLQIAAGLFKKMVIADRLAVFVDTVFADPASHQGLPSVVAVLFFTFQLYLDFSAYSQIAVGTARLFGFRLHDNFNRPYLSATFKEFWKRWHITLNSWFMDYLYIPLGGNRKGKVRTILNVMTVFAVSGLWHGASWNFVIWGCINGLFLVLSDKVFSLKPEGRTARFLSGLLVFCVWAVSLVFFRSPSFGTAMAMFGNLGFSGADLLASCGLPVPELVFSFILIAGLMLFEALTEGRVGKVETSFFDCGTVLRWSVYLLFALSILYLGVYGASENAFIYFQF